MDRSLLQLMLGLGILLFISVFASKTSSRYGIPVLLIFIFIGMLTGSEGIGGIWFDDAASTHVLGTIALSFILFSGGLSTQLKTVAPVWREGITLAFPGIMLSTLLMGGLIHFILPWDWVSCFLLSATISSTDAAAVFGILKTRGLNLKPRIQAVIELESGSNDPMAIFLTITLIKILLTGQVPLVPTFISFFIQMALGGLAGWILGSGMVKLINWLDLELEGLYPVLTIAGVVAIYSLTEFAGGNGFLAVYLAGLTMGEEKFFNKQGLILFHDGLAWLMQVSMFLSLGLLAYPSELMKIAGTGLMLGLGLIFVIRPLTTFICLYPFRYSVKETWFISWGGLRGAVPIILATYLLVSEVPLAQTMFNLVFFIVLLSMLIQGSSLSLMSRWCGMRQSLHPKRRLPLKSRAMEREFIEYEVGPASPLIGKTILEIHLPDDVLVVLIHREERDFIPKGNTEIKCFDRLVCLVDREAISKLSEQLHAFSPWDGNSEQSSRLEDR